MDHEQTVLQSLREEIKNFQQFYQDTLRENFSQRAWGRGRSFQPAELSTFLLEACPFLYAFLGVLLEGDDEVSVVEPDTRLLMVMVALVVGKKSAGRSWRPLMQLLLLYDQFGMPEVRNSKMGRIHVLFQPCISHVYIMYSRTCLERPPHWPQKCGLSRQVTSSVVLKCGSFCQKCVVCQDR